MTSVPLSSNEDLWLTLFSKAEWDIWVSEFPDPLQPAFTTINQEADDAADELHKPAAGVLSEVCLLAVSPKEGNKVSCCTKCTLSYDCTALYQ